MDFGEIFKLTARVARDLAGVTMTLRRGEASVEIVAVKCNGRSSRLVADEIPIASDRCDLRIDPDAYDFGDGPVRPEKGDRFEQTINGELVTYEAARSPEDGDFWRWTDEETRAELRVHVRLKSESDT